MIICYSFKFSQLKHTQIKSIQASPYYISETMSKKIFEILILACTSLLSLGGVIYLIISFTCAPTCSRDLIMTIPYGTNYNDSNSTVSPMLQIKISEQTKFKLSFPEFLHICLADSCYPNLTHCIKCSGNDSLCIKILINEYKNKIQHFFYIFYLF